MPCLLAMKGTDPVPPTCSSLTCVCNASTNNSDRLSSICHAVCRSWCKLHEELTKLNETFKKRSEQLALPPPPSTSGQNGKDRDHSKGRDVDKHRSREHEAAYDSRHRDSRDRDHGRDRYDCTVHTEFQTRAGFLLHVEGGFECQPSTALEQVLLLACMPSIDSWNQMSYQHWNFT